MEEKKYALEYVDKGVTPTKVMEYVNFVMQTSFKDDDSVKSEHLFEYAVTCAVLSMFTNYSGEFDFDSIMSIDYSEEYKNLTSNVLYKNCDMYMMFTDIAYDEIYNQEKRLSVASNMNRLVKALTKTVESIGEILKDADLESLLSNSDVAETIGKFVEGFSEK